MRKVYRFLKYNKNKKIIMYTTFLTAYYRLCILFIPPKTLENHWGNRGKETAWETSREDMSYAMRVAKCVNYVAKRTPWESKCLVQALAAQHLLQRHQINSTLYLGVGKDEQGKMLAHAWVRCGALYVTGGNGKEFAKVASFAR